MGHAITPRNVSCGSVGLLTTRTPVNDTNVDVLPFKGNTRHVLRGGRVNYSVRNVGFGRRNGRRVIHTTRRNVIFSFGCKVSVVRRVNVPIRGVRTNGTGVFLDPLFHRALTNIAKTIVRLCSASNSMNTTGNTKVNINVCGSGGRTFTALRGLRIVRPGITSHRTCTSTCTH